MTVVESVLASLMAKFDAAIVPKVFNGALPPSEVENDYVLVGSTGNDEDSIDVAEEWSQSGPGTWRDEVGTIDCSAWAWDNDADVPTVRARARSYADACADALHADRNLGGLLNGAGAEVTRWRYRSEHGDVGAVARVVFTVSYRTLIT